MINDRLRRFAAWGILSTTVGFGMWPFNFYSDNDVAYDSNAEGLRFHEGGERDSYAQRAIAYTEAPLYFGAASPLTLLFDVIPHHWPDGLATILELHDGGEQPPLMIAQWKNHLAIRSRRIAGYRDRAYQEIGLPNCFQENVSVSLLINYDGLSTRIYVDGQLAVSRKGFHLLDPATPTTARLIFGNNATAEQSWLGTLTHFMLFRDSISPSRLAQSDFEAMIDYQFNQPPIEEVLPNRANAELPLKIPKKFRPVDRKRFTPITKLWERNELWYSDIVINFLGFLPAGVAFTILLSRHLQNQLFIFLTAGMLAVALSAIIECSQFYLPSRDPSHIDWLLNSAGGGFSALLAALMQRKQRRHPILFA